MSAQEIRASYDDLADIAQRFGSHSERAAALEQRVRQRMDAVRDSWQGQGSKAFLAEMEGEVLPAFHRLVEALSEAQRVTTQIAQTFRDAEEEAAALFKGEGNSGGSGSGDPPSEGGGGIPSEGGKNPPDPKPTEQVFSEQSYDELVGSQFEGANSQQLRDAMNVLLRNPSDSERDAALAQIAEARGMTLDQARANWDRYLELRKEADQIRAENGQDPFDPSLRDSHQEFMGSTTQLRYGKMVGDAVGLDPVFGAMLNPSGGLVGPGKNAVWLGDDDPVGYHGVVHDAAGYLYNYHNMGPGYDYLGVEGRDRSSVLTGQESGIRYWNEKLGATGWRKRVSEGAGTAMGEARDAYDWAKERGRGVKDRWNRTREWFGDLFD